MDNEKPAEPAPEKPNGAPEEYLRWPPPGLESLHGRLFPAITMLGVADMVLVVPFVITVIADPGISGTGLWGAWWFAAAAAFAGLLLAFLGIDKLYHMLRAGSQAARLGHSLSTMLLVASDSTRDTGFVLQGTRLFRQASKDQREKIMKARVLQGLAYLFAALWAPLMLAMGIVAASRGLIGRTTMLMLVAVIPLVVFTVAVFIAVAEMVAIRSIDRRKNREFGTAQDRARVDEWYQSAAAFTESTGNRGGSALAGRLKLSYILLGILGILMAVPVIAISVAGAVGPIIASIAIPNYSNVAGRVATTNVLRRYRLPGDSSITSVTAGQSLHALMWVGNGQDTTAMLQATRTYDSPWFPGDDPGADRFQLQDSVLALFPAARRLDAEDLRYMNQIAGHPGLAEWRTTGSAVTADVFGTRYILPFSEAIREQPFALPFPTYRGIRDGALAQIVAAASELRNNRPDRAEMMIREVLSTGFLLIDEGPVLIDNMIGASLVSFAGDALVALYRETGRTTEAETIEWMRIQADEIASPQIYRAVALEETLEELKAIVEDEGSVRGLRWDSFIIVNSLSPCMNISRIVFGSGGALEHWRGRAGESLVRYESEGHLLDLYENGFFGGASMSRAIIPRMFGIVFGSRTQANECVNALSSL